jgi:hypothetical protein
MACTLLSLTACSARSDGSGSSDSAPISSTEQTTVKPTTATTEAPTQPEEPEPATNPPGETDEYGLPVMSEANQEIYDKYFMSDHASVNIFQSSFDKDNVEHFLPEAVYEYLTQPEEDADVPQDEVEALLMKYFPFSPEMIRTFADRYYDSENQTYAIWVLPRGEQSEESFHGAVTSSSIAGDKLTVDCVWYWSSYPDNPSSFEPYATSQTVIIIKSDTEWFYESNEAVDIRPQE